MKRLARHDYASRGSDLRPRNAPLKVARLSSLMAFLTLGFSSLYIQSAGKHWGSLEAFLLGSPMRRSLVTTVSNLDQATELWLLDLVSICPRSRNESCGAN